MRSLRLFSLVAAAGAALGLLLAAPHACGLAAAAEGGCPVKLLVTVYGEGEAGEFAYPAALATGEQLTVADTGNRRLLFYAAGESEKFRYLGKFSAGGKLGAPFCVAELGGGKLLVAERGKGTLTLCDPKADTATPAVLQGVPQAGSLVPGRFCVGPRGKVYLIDAGLKRILVLTPELRFEGEVTVGDKDFTGFSDVRVDRKGDIFALETIRGKVYVFGPSLKPVRSFGSRQGAGATFEFPVSLALDRHGNVYVLDAHRAQVLVLDCEGRLQWRLGGFGWKEGSFNDPGYISVDGAGRVFVVDRMNNRIEVFAPQRAM